MKNNNYLAPVEREKYPQRERYPQSVKMSFERVLI